jgi:transposase InsO family protein
MGQILHKRAKTTHAVRAEIQQSKESIAALSRKFGVSQNTISKWKRRQSVEDKKMGSHKLRTVLTEKDEEMICAFRRKTGLPLDDCYISLKDFIPKLTRSNLHRCLKRHGLSVLPKDKPEKKKGKFSEYEIGFFHIDICEIRTGEGKCYLFVAIDRTSKYAYAEIYKSPTTSNSVTFLRNLINHIPHKIHRILTDNGAQFTYNMLDERSKPKEKIHAFDKVCADHSIIHKTTKFRHPWTNGQVERMNRTIKEATVKKYHYDSESQFKQHLYDFLNVYNFAKKLKSLKFKSPWDFIVDYYKKNATIFTNNPHNYSMGLNS